MSGTDAALLSLIVDDDETLRVLAAWAAVEYPMSAVDDEAAVGTLAMLTDVTPLRVETAMRRILASRAMTAEGISDLADRLLQQRVMLSLSMKVKK